MIKKTIRNWKVLESVMADVRFNKNPTVISFNEDKLESLTFETVKGYKKHEVKE